MTKEQMVSQLGTISNHMGTFYSSAEEVAEYIYAADEYMEGNDMFGERYDKGVLKECFQKYCDICSTLNAIKTNAENYKSKLIQQIQQESREKKSTTSTGNSDKTGTSSTSNTSGTSSSSDNSTKRAPNPNRVQKVLE